MKKNILILGIALFYFVTLSLGQNEKEIQLADLWAGTKYVSASIDEVVPMNNDENYTILENSFQLNEYEYKSGKQTRAVVNFHDVFKEAGLKGKVINEFAFCKDETKILVATETESIYRHSKASKYYVYDIRQKKITPLSEQGKQRLASFSPDGNKVAYIIDNNIYIRDLKAGTETQITNDGKHNEIINGATDWVYEEEFEFSQAYFWSEDGNNIAFYRFDEKNVKEFSLTMYGKLYPEEYKYKYPKAGEDNAIVTIHIYNLLSGKTIDVETGEEKDQYIPRVKWSKDPDKLAVFRLNRLQNHLEILMADASTGKTNLIYEEKNKCYIEINDNLTFTDDGKFFILTSESNGYNHIYRYDMSGKLFNKITDGEWDVIKILGYNPGENIIYYTSFQNSPMDIHVYSVGIDGSNPTRLSANNGHNKPSFSKNYKYFINEFSDINTPPVYTVNLSKNGNPIRTIEDNKTLNETLKNLNISNAEFFTFKNSENISLNGWMLKPKDFNPEKKYPVLFYVYGGPGAQTVENKWGEYDFIWFQMMTQKGYIVVSIDNRGTSGRGEAFKKSTYLQLGKFETVDQIDAAKYLASLPYVDKDRLGMFGWSYGGYLTLLCMTKGAEYFKMGIAVAPVTNWRYYDSVYTERYNGLPKDNADGYDSNSPISQAKKLKGKLLIIHGSADDNVHYQNTMEMTNALVNANKPFDMQIYTNKNHGIYGGYTRLHLFQKMTDYVVNNL